MNLQDICVTKNQIKELMEIKTGLKHLSPKFSWETKNAINSIKILKMRANYSHVPNKRVVCVVTSLRRPYA